MKKLAAWMLCFTMALPLAACGAEPAAGSGSSGQSTPAESPVETPAESSVEAPAESSEEAPAESSEEAPAENPADESSAPEETEDNGEEGLMEFISQLSVLAPTEDVVGTEWEFAGGMADGIEMGEEEAAQSLEAWGGTMQLRFGDDGNIQMIQGNGTMEGTYGLQEDGYLLGIVFDNAGTEIKYAGLLADVDGSVALMLFPDATGQNAIYFAQTAENAGEASGGEISEDLTNFISQLALVQPSDAIVNTGWEFSGGILGGVEMDEEMARQSLETWGGTLQVVFGEEGYVTMIQGNGTMEGTYGVTESGNTLVIVFDNEGTAVNYAGLFADVDGTVALMLFPDSTAQNVVYLTQITEG